MTPDHIDFSILAELQRDGRISNAELAQRINLSPTPSLRRLRKLETGGVIRRYTAILDRQALGLNIYAFAFVTITKNTQRMGEEFEQQVSAIPEVMECCAVAGAYDYLLRIVTHSLDDYNQLLKNQLASLNMVAGIETTIVLNQIHERTALPLKQS